MEIPSLYCCMRSDIIKMASFFCIPVVMGNKLSPNFKTATVIFHSLNIFNL